MISLEIRPYCDNCMDFEADVEKSCLEDFFGNEYDYRVVVRCKHREKCKHIHIYLKEKQKERQDETKNTEVSSETV